MADLKGQLPADLQGPPEYLTPEASEFFLHVVSTGSYDAPARALLIRFCEVRDQLVRIRIELKTGNQSFTFNDKHGQPRIHPLVKHELALTNEFGKLFRLLGWDQAPPDGQLSLFPSK
jgi:phage terminase small subunit